MTNHFNLSQFIDYICKKTYSTLKKIIISLLFFACVAFRSEDFKPYTEHIPGLQHGLDMQPIPAGEFTMGSPASEKDRKPDEGPQHKVIIDAFWMAKYETSWEMYEAYFNKELEVKDEKNTAEVATRVGTVARPTQPYVEMSFGQGKESGFPVCNVTQFAARSFCKWLYAKTGYFYRLPTEAEWEYAARAGSKTTFYFGDDASKMKEYAWYFENSDGAYKKSGQLKPNDWGLYDMYGNVAEWTSDLYVADFYSKPEAVTCSPWTSSTQPIDFYRMGWSVGVGFGLWMIRTKRDFMRTPTERFLIYSEISVELPFSVCASTAAIPRTSSHSPEQ